MDEKRNTQYELRYTKQALLIAALVFGIYLFIAGRTTLWDRDEPRFARATVEMVESGNYLVPTFNGNLRPDKPILVYWLMSLPVRLLGPTELACRFFSAVGSAITCILTFLIGRRLIGTKAGLWAMLILASTLMMMVVGTAATSDAIVLPFALAALAVFTCIITGNKAVSLYHTTAMAVAFGFGMLAKGPIGLLSIPAIAITLWLTRKSTPNTKSYLGHVLFALCAGGLIFVSWGIPANNATGGELLRLAVGHHVIGRAVRPLEHHGGSFLLNLPYYLPVIIVGFFPWTLHLPGAFSAMLGGRIVGRQGRILLTSWIVSTLVLMTLVATKLPHYVLFTWPAMAIVVAGTITAAEKNILTARDRAWLRGGIWFFGPVAGLTAVGLIAGPSFMDVKNLQLYGVVCALVLLATAVVAIRLQLAEQFKRSALVLLAGMFVLQILLVGGVLPKLEQVKISPYIAQVVKDKTGPAVQVATYKYAEPTLNFYIGRKIENLRTEQEVVSWAKQPQSGVLIIPKDLLLSMHQKYSGLALDEIGLKKGFNYSKGKTVEVAAVIRR
jgi:4-amino-4-deoxy-L-arabinose transferase-like glycosyltransferase